MPPKKKRHAQRDAPVVETQVSRTGVRGDLATWWHANSRDMKILGGIWLAAVFIYWLLGNGHVTLRRYQDEFLYWELAQSLANGDGFSWRGDPESVRSPLYIIYSALAFLPGWDTIGTYRAIHLLNAIAMPAVIFPTFVLARQYASRIWAYAAALLAISIAAMNYIGIVGTENLAYPVAALLLASTVAAVAWPQRRFWIAATLMLVIAVLTRTQFFVFAVVMPLAIVLVAVLQSKGERKAFLRERKEPLLLFSGVAAFVLLGLAAFPDKLLGLYAPGLDFPNPSIADLWYWLKGFMADVFIMTGIVPAIAALALMFDRENWRRPELGALLAVTLLATAALVAQVTWFSATNPYGWEERSIFYERYLFYAAPPIFVCLAAFFRFGKRTPLYVAAGVSVVLLALFNSKHILTPFSYDAWSLTPLGGPLKENESFGSYIPWILAFLGLAGAAILYYAVPRERLLKGAAWGAVGFAAVLMLWGQIRSWAYAHENSELAKLAIPAPVDFIDQSTDLDVGMIITSTDSPEMYYSAEFWNDQITRAFVLPKSPIVYSPTCPLEFADDGTIRSSDCPSIPRAFYIRHESVRMTMRDLEKVVEPLPGARLLIAEAPARVAAIVDGRNIVTGTVNEQFLVRTFARPGSVLMLEFEPDAGASVKAGDRTYSLAGGTVRVPVEAGDTSTTFALTGAGSAVLEKIELVEPGAKPLDLTK